MESSQKNSSNRLHPLLRDLPEELLLALNDCSTQSRFAAGKVICEAGKPASRILLIQEGQVSLEVTLGGTTQVGILGPGDFLGCPWFGEKHDWPVTARALGEVTAQSIFASRLQELFEASPQAGKEFALRLARGMDEQLAGAHNQIARVSRLALESQVMALIALVILPVLPNQTFGPYAVINPFEIWLMVVLIVGISLAAYVISRLVSAKKGTLLAGILGGLISSTATTVSCARRSRDSQLAVRVSAAIILISMPIVFARVIFEVAVVAPEILGLTFPPLVLVMLVMNVMAWLSFRNCTSNAAKGEEHPPSDLKTAIGFGLLYMVVLIAAAAARDHFGNSGLYVVAFISGLTDMDAITLSSAQLVKSGQLPATDCWRVILVGALSNLAFKYGVVAVLGNRELMRRTAWGFAVSLLAGILVLALWP